MEDSQHDDWTPDPSEHSAPESAEQRARRRAVEIAQDARFCMLTSAAGDGALHARPMTPQQVTDQLEAWFFVSRGSEQAADVARRAAGEPVLRRVHRLALGRGPGDGGRRPGPGQGDVEPGRRGVVPGRSRRPGPGAAEGGRRVGGVLEGARRARRLRCCRSSRRRSTASRCAASRASSTSTDAAVAGRGGCPGNRHETASLVEEVALATVTRPPRWSRRLPWQPSRDRLAGRGGCPGNRPRPVVACGPAPRSAVRSPDFETARSPGQPRGWPACSLTGFRDASRVPSLRSGARRRSSIRAPSLRLTSQARSAEGRAERASAFAFAGPLPARLVRRIPRFRHAHRIPLTMKERSSRGLIRGSGESSSLPAGAEADERRRGGVGWAARRSRRPGRPPATRPAPPGRASRRAPRRPRRRRPGSVEDVTHRAPACSQAAVMPTTSSPERTEARPSSHDESTTMSGVCGSWSMS